MKIQYAMNEIFDSEPLVAGIRKSIVVVTTFSKK